MEKDRLINKVCQDTNDIYSRLFDHRPFLNGEIHSFLREFEDKKGNRDIEALLKCHQKLTELNDTLSHFPENFKDTVKNFQEQVAETTVRVQTICIPKVIEDNKLAESKEIRQNKWQVFLDQNTSKLWEVENLAKEKELEYRQHYAELEEKLKIT